MEKKEALLAEFNEDLADVALNNKNKSHFK